MRKFAYIALTVRYSRDTFEAAMKTQTFSTSSSLCIREDIWPVNYYCCLQDDTNQPRRKIRKNEIDNINGSAIFSSHAFSNWFLLRETKAFEELFVTSAFVTHRHWRATAGNIWRDSRYFRQRVCAHMPPRNLIQCCSLRRWRCGPPNATTFFLFSSFSLSLFRDHVTFRGRLLAGFASHSQALFLEYKKKKNIGNVAYKIHIWLPVISCKWSTTHSNANEIKNCDQTIATNKFYRKWFGQRERWRRRANISCILYFSSFSHLRRRRRPFLGG